MFWKFRSSSPEVFLRKGVMSASGSFQGLCLSAINFHSVKVFEVFTSFPFNKLIYLKKKKKKKNKFKKQKKKKKTSFKQQKITFCHVAICFSNENKVI